MNLKIHVLRLPRFGNFDLWTHACGGFSFIQTNVSKTAGKIHEIELSMFTGMIYHLIER